MSAFIFFCPFCNQKLKCDESLDGEITACPKCGKEIVPTRPEAAPASPQQDKKSSPAKNENASAAMNSAALSEDAKIRKDSPARKRSLQARFFRYSTADGDFKNPFLSNLFYYAGMIKLVLAITFFALELIARYSFGTVWELVALGVLVDGLLEVGLAQILHCIGKTCYNTDVLVELVKAEAKEKERS